jgi:hypothetical protein
MDVFDVRLGVSGIMIEPEQNKGQMKYFIVELSDTNTFNNDQNLVRIKYNSSGIEKYFDFYLLSKLENPNALDHYGLLVTTEDIIEGLGHAILKTDERYLLPPGYKDEVSLVDEVPFGFVWLVARRVKSNTTNYNDGAAGIFNKDAKIPAEPQNVKYSISPPLARDYTTTRTKKDGDLNNENIGIFITDNSIVLKSHSASIILGPEGISFLGDKFESKTKGGRGMMMDNPFSGWFPSTIMTIPLGIEYIPNFNYILSIGTACRILTKGMKSINRTVTNVQKLGK